MVGYEEDTVFDDLDNEHRNDTREFSVRCMKHAIGVKGNGLTARYLYDKVKKLKMKIFEEILMEETDKILRHVN